jgi:[ribosomal protein S18]-alanine N-acetyltransferase
MAIEAILRPAIEDDLPGLVEVERAAFAVPNWPSDTFLRYDCTVAEVSGVVGGFLVSREIFRGSPTAPPEREILNLAVDPRYRRAGIATLLMRLEFRKGAVFLLEVRDSNLGARALYDRLGFVEISRRREYYTNPTETAIVMRLK